MSMAWTCMYTTCAAAHDFMRTSGLKRYRGFCPPQSMTQRPANGTTSVASRDSDTLLGVLLPRLQRRPGADVHLKQNMKAWEASSFLTGASITKIRRALRRALLLKAGSCLNIGAQVCSDVGFAGKGLSFARVLQSLLRLQVMDIEVAITASQSGVVAKGEEAHVISPGPCVQLTS